MRLCHQLTFACHFSPLLIRGIGRSSSLVLHSSTLSMSNLYTESIPEPTLDEINSLLSFFEKKQRILVITGAGVSTESNLSDYRGPYGSYKRGHKPMNHTDFVTNEKARKRYWARSMIGWQSFLHAKPNNAHYALAQLELSGKINGIVTQNVDRLHQKAGSIRVTDLHGRNDRICCLECGYESARRIIQEQLMLMNKDIYEDHIRSLNEQQSSNSNINSNNLSVQRPDGDSEIGQTDLSQIPGCSRCGGVVKPTVVFFGDNVPSVKVNSIYESVEECDGLLVVGTSLEVLSAYRFVDQMSKQGKEIAIISHGQTRAERSSLPHIVFKSEARCSSLLRAVATQLASRDH